jgi:hypothetical protein
MLIGDCRMLRSVRRKGNDVLLDLLAEAKPSREVCRYRRLVNLRPLPRVRALRYRELLS